MILPPTTSSTKISPGPGAADPQAVVFPPLRQKISCCRPRLPRPALANLFDRLTADMTRGTRKSAALLATGLALVLPSAAQASQTIGQTGSPLVTCTADEAYIQTTLAAGPSYSPSAYGVITSWSALASADPSQTVRLIVLRQDSSTQFSIVARDSIIRTLTSPTALNTFTGTRVPIEPSQRIGVYLPVSSQFSCEFGTGDTDGAGYSAPFGVGEPPDNTPFDYSGTDNNRLVNAQAVVEPDVDRDVFGDETQDKCVGTPGQINGCPSTLTINGASQSGKNAVVVTATVPGQGKVSAGAANDPNVLAAAAKKTKKKKRTNIALTPASQTVTAKTSQQVRLTLALTKSAKSKLKQKGKLKVSVKATYTPTGGPTGTQFSQVKLKLKKK
jgi:hypothetical protein